MVVCEWLQTIPSSSADMLPFSSQRSWAMLSLCWKHLGQCCSSALCSWLHREHKRRTTYSSIQSVLQVTCPTAYQHISSHDRLCLHARKYACNVCRCSWLLFNCQHARVWYNISRFFDWKVSYYIYPMNYFTHFDRFAKEILWVGKKCLPVELTFCKSWLDSDSVKF